MYVYISWSKSLMRRLFCRMFITLVLFERENCFISIFSRNILYRCFLWNCKNVLYTQYSKYSKYTKCFMPPINNTENVSYPGRNSPHQACRLKSERPLNDAFDKLVLDWITVLEIFLRYVCSERITVADLSIQTKRVTSIALTFEWSWFVDTDLITSTFVCSTFVNV